MGEDLIKSSLLRIGKGGYEVRRLECIPLVELQKRFLGLFEEGKSRPCGGLTCHRGDKIVCTGRGCPGLPNGSSVPLATGQTLLNFTCLTLRPHFHCFFSSNFAFPFGSSLRVQLISAFFAFSEGFWPLGTCNIDTSGGDWTVNWDLGGCIADASDGKIFFFVCFLLFAQLG